MNDLILAIQDEVIAITKTLNTALTAKEKLELLQGRINDYMGIEEGSPLEGCKEVLDKVMNSVINDLYLKVSESLYQIDSMEAEELEGLYDDLPDDQELAELDKLAEGKEPEAGQDHDQEGGAE